jgi:hypothetical protein
LVTRLVTTAYAHPASAHRYLQEVTTAGLYFGQFIAVVDVPVEIEPGSYEILVQTRRIPNPQTNPGFIQTLNVDLANEGHVLEVLNDNGAGENFTPYEGHIIGVSGDVSGYIANLYVYPRVRLNVIQGQAPIPAVHLRVQYPPNKIAIKDIFHDPIDDLGVAVVWSDTGFGELTIDVAGPNADLKVIAIVFDVVNPSTQRLATIADFTVLETIRYDTNGVATYFSPAIVQEIW